MNKREYTDLIALLQNDLSEMRDSLISAKVRCDFGQLEESFAKIAETIERYDVMGIRLKAFDCPQTVRELKGMVK